MKIFKDIDKIENLKLENTVVALGKFDGVHKGHYKILEKLKEEKTNGLTSLVFNFSKNPKNIEQKNESKLFTEEEQLLVYERMEVDILIIYPIEMGILSMQPEEFVEKILVNKLGVKKIVCGENFKFGKNRIGNTDLLSSLGERYGYDTEIIKLLSYNGSIISSTLIKEHIRVGNLKEAEEMLGHKYIIIGKVIHGYALGRTMNAPTANIVPTQSKLLPPNGVYISCCNIDGKVYKGVTNIGYKPTIESENKLGVETFFLDFDGDLYGRILEIELLFYIRAEKKFDNIDDLKAQILYDIDICRKYHLY